MRHRVAGKHLGRTPSHRKALRRNMAMALFEHGAIRTTEAKAKELRRFVEKLITLAKKGTLHARRLVLSRLGDRHLSVKDEKLGEFVRADGEKVVHKLFADIAPKYAERNGGYTRIVHISERRLGDGGKQVILQLVEEDITGGSDTGSGKRREKAAMRHKAAGDLAKQKAEPKTTEADAEEAPVAEKVAEESAEDATAAADQADDASTDGADDAAKE